MKYTKEEWDEKLGLLPRKHHLYLDNKDVTNYSWVSEDCIKPIYLSIQSLDRIYQHFKVLSYYDSWLYKTEIFLKRVWYFIIFKKQRILRKENKKEKYLEVLDMLYNELSVSELR